MARQAQQRQTVAYCRVSTEDQATEGYSLGDQERACRKYVEARAGIEAAGWPEIAEVYTDAGVSGATRDRPELKRLLADAKAGKVGRVVCTKLDRIGRRAADILAIEDELDSYGVERVYIKDSIDTSTATGRLLRTVLAAVAELERDTIVERTKAGAMEKARRGGVDRSRGIYGYRTVATNPLTGQRGGLEPDPATAPVVQRIIKSVAEGVTGNAMARILTAEGVPTPRGAKVWWETTVRHIVKNQEYTGWASYGRLKNERYRDANGRAKTRAVRNDQSKVIRIPIPALVSPELAQAAQDQLARNFKFSPRNARHDYLLGGGGLLYCGVCAAAGEAHTMRGYIVRNRYRRYRCMVMREDGRRDSHSVAAGPVEAAVWGTLCETLRDPSRLLADVAALADSSTQQARGLEEEMGRVEKAVAGLDDRLGRLLDLYLRRGLTEGQYASKCEELQAQREVQSNRLLELAARRDTAQSHALPVDDVKAMCALVAVGLDKLTFEERRDIVRRLCTRITASRDSVVIEGKLPGLTPELNGHNVSTDNTTPPR